MRRALHILSVRCIRRLTHVKFSRYRGVVLSFEFNTADQKSFLLGLIIIVHPSRRALKCSCFAQSFRSLRETVLIYAMNGRIKRRCPTAVVTVDHKACMVQSIQERYQAVIDITRGIRHSLAASRTDPSHPPFHAERGVRGGQCQWSWTVT